MIKPPLFSIHGVFNTFSGRKKLMIWETSFGVNFIFFPEMMRNLIFDLENGGSTYTRGRLIHEVDLYTSKYGNHKTQQKHIM